MSSQSVVFCRVSQMGFLRLLTTRFVMGDDVLPSRDAWLVYRDLLSDIRIKFAPEPYALEPEWRKWTLRDKPSPKVWTDAYLSAFAHTGGMRMVTLDRALLAIAPDALVLK